MPWNERISWGMWSRVSGMPSSMVSSSVFMAGSDEVALCTSPQVITDVEASADESDSCRRVSESLVVSDAAEKAL